MQKTRNHPKNKMHKIFRDFDKQTNHLILARQPDCEIIEKEKWELSIQSKSKKTKWKTSWSLYTNFKWLKFLYVLSFLIFSLVDGKDCFLSFNLVDGKDSFLSFSLVDGNHRCRYIQISFLFVLFCFVSLPIFWLSYLFLCFLNISFILSHGFHFGLVSLFNGISTYMNYLMPKVYIPLSLLLWIK